MTLTRDQLKEQVADLAIQGVCIGTSSWKYPGWCGTVYDRFRYEYRGKFAESRLQTGLPGRICPGFQDRERRCRLLHISQCAVSGRHGGPGAGGFPFRVQGKFPNLERFGELAGKPNEQFLNAELFVKGFLRPCEAIRPKVGLLMFECSKFWLIDYEHGRDFIADLDKFLGQLPKGWLYGVEMRNRNWLKPEYCECLARHQVTHVFNSWEAMPPVGEQMALPGSRTNPDLVAARFLLKPGRKYEQAVKTFEPYDSVKEENPEARAAGRALVEPGKVAGPKRKPFVFLNNRLEGDVISIIAALMQR